jgi:hypothetical protein
MTTDIDTITTHTHEATLNHGESGGVDDVYYDDNQGMNEMICPTVHPSSEQTILSMRNNELSILCAQQQQNNQVLATVIEQLEKTVAASIDRLIRRLERMENRQRNERTVFNTNHHNNTRASSDTRSAKRSRYGGR